ncbi:mechanosensitive channel MscK, partial [Klebsiella pneumoniae]
MLHTISRQRATFIFIITLLCFIGLFSPVQGRAADLPDRAEVQSQLNTLNKQKELTPQDKLVQQDLTQTLETLDKIERIKSETAQLRQQVEQAPAKLRQAVESLNNLSDVPN